MSKENNYKEEIENKFTTSDKVCRDDEEIAGAEWFRDTIHKPEVERLEDENRKMKDLLTGLKFCADTPGLSLNKDKISKEIFEALKPAIIMYILLCLIPM